MISNWLKLRRETFIVGTQELIDETTDSFASVDDAIKKTHTTSQSTVEKSEKVLSNQEEIHYQHNAMHSTIRSRFEEMNDLAKKSHTRLKVLATLLYFTNTINYFKV